MSEGKPYSHETAPSPLPKTLLEHPATPRNPSWQIEQPSSPPPSISQPLSHSRVSDASAQLRVGVRYPEEYLLSPKRRPVGRYQ